MSIFEYDAQKHIAQEKEESYSEGRIEERIQWIMNSYQKSTPTDIANMFGCDIELIEGIYSIMNIHGQDVSPIFVFNELKKQDIKL